MAFDPNKHRKTTAKLATLSNEKNKNWMVSKPSANDYIQIWGDKLEDLDLVNCFKQRDGMGEEKLWLIQGGDEEEDEKIIKHLGPRKIITALVCPCIIAVNKRYFIWMANQGDATENKHTVHLQIRECIKEAQKGWRMVYWDKTTKQYLMEPPESAEALGKPTWLTKEEITAHLVKSFEDRMIESVDHEIVKRTRGLIA